MLAAASYVDGNQIVLLYLGILVLLTLALIALSVWLVKAAKRKIGNRAYWLAPLPFLVALLIGFVIYLAQAPSSGPPAVLPATKLSAMIKALPDYTNFAYSGLAFYKGKLYVATNLGLLELEQGRAVSLYRFQKRYSVVSGPWLDEANQLLWVMDEETRELLNYNGSVWHRVGLAKPPKGYYSRGDALEGVRPIGNKDAFWLASGGGVWRWDPANDRWTIPPMPTLDSQYADAIIGVLPLDSKLLFIVRHEVLSFLVKDGQDFASDTIVTDDGGWHTVANETGLKFFADSWAVTDQGGYLCTRNGLLLRVTPERLQSSTRRVSSRRWRVLHWELCWRAFAAPEFTNSPRAGSFATPIRIPAVPATTGRI
jgi:hypothetical protein